MEVTQFETLITAVSREFGFNSIITEEDVKQELYEKLIKVWPDLMTNKPEEIFAVAKTVFRRRMIDIGRFQARRPDTSIYAKNYVVDEDGYEFNDIESLAEQSLDAMCDANLMNGSLFKNPYEETEGNDLKEELLAFADVQVDEDIRRFIHEAINPSKETLDTWEEMCNGYARYKSYTSIPPFSLCKILGITKNKKIYHILETIKQFLDSIHYESVYIQ